MLDGLNADSLTGLRLGSCTLEAPLGFGGMGAVYLAQQERPHRRVAVKVLRRQPAMDADAWSTFLARFRREADATAALDHANIVPIFEFGEEGDIAYLVMPYLADGSVAALLDREGTLPLARVVEYIEQAAAALDYAHKHGIVHRDVKPSNLLLHPDGRLLLADFGIARMLNEGEIVDGVEQHVESSALTQSGSAMGTPEYMSPEQVRGEHVGPAADIYALGIVACVMLLGYSPFAGGDVDAVLMRQLVAPPQPLRIERPSIPSKVEESIFYALAKSPGDRPATAGDFASALRAASRGRGFGALLGWSLPEQALALPPAPVEYSEPTALVVRRRNTGTLPLPPAARARTQQPATGKDASRGAALAAGPGPLLSIERMAVAPSPPGLNALPSSEPTIMDLPLGDMPTSAGGDGRRTAGAKGAGASLAPEWHSPSAQRLQSQHGISGWQWFALVAAVVVVLVGSFALASVLATGNLPFGRAFGSLPGGDASATYTPMPTVTSQPTTTLTSLGPSTWLSVSPVSVTLGCKSKSHHTITLTNSGPDTVPWVANVVDSTGASTTGISLSTRSGELESRHSVTITITNTSFFMDHQGTITFLPADEEAGAGPVVEYSTISCGQ